MSFSRYRTVGRGVNGLSDKGADWESILTRGHNRHMNGSYLSTKEMCPIPQIHPLAVSGEPGFSVFFGQAGMFSVFQEDTLLDTRFLYIFNKVIYQQLLDLYFCLSTYRFGKSEILNTSTRHAFLSFKLKKTFTKLTGNIY